jgi:hypothetical protein
MRGKSSHNQGVEPDEFGFRAAKWDFESGRGAGANSSEDVIGEIGVVLIVILGIVVAVNMVLGAFHIG